MNKPDDVEFVLYLIELRDRDYLGFMELVLESLKSFPDLAIEEPSSLETKHAAMTKVMEYFEGAERYEDCAFLRDLKQKAEDAAQG